jgi:hypothetical protein
MKVKNMLSHSGNPVANQFIIEDCTIHIYHKETDSNLPIKGDLFQSYDSNIAFLPCYECKGSVSAYLDSKYWDYSMTTGKYRNVFLGETKKETEKKIKSGEYKLVNLN